MEIQELYQLTNTLKDIVTKHNYLTLVNQLRSGINQYKANKANPLQHQQALTAKGTVESTRINAMNALQQIQQDLKEYKIVKAVNQLKTENPYGEYAKNLLTRLPKELDTNIEGAIAEITQHYQKVHAYQQFTTSINAVLGDHSLRLENDNNELILFFEGEASVGNLKQLSEVSTEWNLIVNCFSRLTKENNTDIQIVSIKKGSLIATLSIASIIIGGIISASDKILNQILKVYEIKKKALELKQMRLENIAKAIEILESQTTLNLEVQSKFIVDELMGEFGWKEQDAGYQETESAVIKGVKKMMVFHNKGGKVDAKYLEPNENQRAKVISIQEKNKKFLNVEAELGRLSEGGEILKIEDSDARGDDEIGQVEDDQIKSN